MATLDRLVPPVALPLEGPTWRPRRAIAVAIIAAAAIALLLVSQSSNVANTGETLRRLEREQTERQARVHSLEAEVAALASLDRVERQARERLGMIAARNIVYLEVAVEAPAGALLPRPVSEDAAPRASSERGTSWLDRLLRITRLD